MATVEVIAATSALAVEEKAPEIVLKAHQETTPEDTVTQKAEAAAEVEAEAEATPAKFESVKEEEVVAEEVKGEKPDPDVETATPEVESAVKEVVVKDVTGEEPDPDKAADVPAHEDSTVTESPVKEEADEKPIEAAKKEEEKPVVEVEDKTSTPEEDKTE